MHIRAVLLSAFFLLLPASLLANTVTYTYFGSDFTDVTGSFTTSDSISGSFATSSPLADNLNAVEQSPSAFSFSDGLQTITNLDGTVADFRITTDGSGDIVFWDIWVIGALGNEIIINASDLDYGYYNGPGWGENNGVNGTWSSEDTATTPEPSSLILMATGLLALGLAFRRQIASGLLPNKPTQP